MHKESLESEMMKRENLMIHKELDLRTNPFQERGMMCPYMGHLRFLLIMDINLVSSSCMENTWIVGIMGLSKVMYLGLLGCRRSSQVESHVGTVTRSKGKIGILPKCEEASYNGRTPK